MDGLITIICYKNCEIIDDPNGAGYSCPLERGVLVNNMITYDELEDMTNPLPIDRESAGNSTVTSQPSSLD